MNTVITNTPAVTVQFPKYIPTKDEKKILNTAHKHLSQLEVLLAEVVDMKTYAAKLTNDLVKGNATIEAVGPMLWAISDTSRRQEIAAALRTVLKGQMREILATVQSVFDARQRMQADHVKKLAADTEASERRSQEKAGLLPDEYQPSPHVAGLRETYARLLEYPANPSRQGIDEMLANSTQ